MDAHLGFSKKILQEGGTNADRVDLERPSGGFFSQTGAKWTGTLITDGPVRTARLGRTF